VLTRCCRIAQSIVQQCCERIDRTRGVACNRLLSIIQYDRYVVCVHGNHFVSTLLFIPYSPVIPHIPHHEDLLAIFNKYVCVCVCTVLYCTVLSRVNNSREGECLTLNRPV